MGFERTDAAYTVGEREVVSTIEEAREQAREAKTAYERAFASDDIALVIAASHAQDRAIQALLDATEPRGGCLHIAWELDTAGEPTRCADCGEDMSPPAASFEPALDVVGRFSFDGAEDIAFWVGNPDAVGDGPVTVMMHELPLLELFLRRNFPGLLADDATEPPAPLSAEPAPKCSCPSGDGSLRWPCQAHMPDCARCGASLQGRRYATAQRDSRRGAYCHDDDDMGPSCYERSSWTGFRELEPVLANVKIDPVLDIPAEQMSTEGEREALVDVIRLFFQNWRSIGKVSAALEVSIDSLEGAVDDLIELGEPRPITDEMAKAGARALNDAGWTYEGADEPGCWCEDCQAVCMPPARAILEAADEARR